MATHIDTVQPDRIAYLDGLADRDLQVYAEAGAIVRETRQHQPKRTSVILTATVTTDSPCCHVEYPYRLVLAEHGWVFLAPACGCFTRLQEHERAALEASLIDAASEELCRLAGVQMVGIGAGGAGEGATGGEGEASSVTAASSPGAEVWFGGAPADLLPVGYAAASTLPCAGFMGEDC